MPPEQSNPRGYARRGGSSWRGRGRGRGANKQYPGQPQNPDDNNETNGAKRWERPRTSTQRFTQDGNGVATAAGLNTPMVQVDEIPAHMMQTQRSAQPRSRQVEGCPWIDWDLYLPQQGRLILFCPLSYSQSASTLGTHTLITDVLRLSP